MACVQQRLLCSSPGPLDQQSSVLLPSVRHQFISVRVLSSRPLPFPSSCPDQRSIGHLLLPLYHSSFVRAISVGPSVRRQANAYSPRQPCSVFYRRVIASLVFICLRHLFSPLPVFDTRVVSLASSLPRRHSYICPAPSLVPAIVHVVLLLP